MTCTCGQFLRKFYRAGRYVRICPTCQLPKARTIAPPDSRFQYQPKSTGLGDQVMAMRHAGMSQSAICLALNISNGSYRMYVINARKQEQHAA